MVCPIVALPPIIEISPALPLTSSAPGLLMRLRGTSERVSGAARRGREGADADRPAELEEGGWDTGGRGRERNMCLQKEDISFGDVYRLLPTTAGAGWGGRQHTNIARGQLGSGCVRACIRRKKLAIHPSIHLAIHPLLWAPHVALLAPSQFLTLPPLLLSSPFSNFDLAFRPSVCPAAQTRPSHGRLSAS